MGWLVGLFVLGVQGCATSNRPYRWVDEAPPGANDLQVYRISPRDVISVRVWNQESMSLERARVREDGKISLPFLQDVRVAGFTPEELSDSLKRSLEPFIVDPIVTVTLEEPAPLGVSVVGEVTNAGTFTLEHPAGVLHALAAAGGINQYADREGIYVLRRVSLGIPPMRIRFRYKDLVAGGNRASNFLLQSGDIVVVE